MEYTKRMNTEELIELDHLIIKGGLNPSKVDNKEVCS